MNSVAWYRDHFQAVHPTLPNTASNELTAWRVQHLEQFLTQGFPTRQQENWRYTDLSLLEQQAFALANPQTLQVSSPLLADYLLKDTAAVRLVFINGYYQAALSQVSALPTGALLMPLSQALRVCPHKVMPYLQRNVVRQPLVHLNAAFMTDGLFLYLPAQRVMTQPIHLLFLADTPQAAMHHIHNVIVIDEQAEVTLFEQYAALNTTPYWNNTVTQIHTAKGARAYYYKMQQENLEAWHLAHVHFNQQQDSQIHAWQGAFGAKLAREDWRITLAEANATAVLHGWYGATQQQHLAHQVKVEHCAPHTTSQVFYKGLAHERATAVFNGKILVQPAAQKTQAKLTNQNLLLATTATINTKPELEIYADDVQCAHGATVGQLDEEALFYLRARGIAKPAAQHLLLQAFAANMVEFIGNEAIKDMLGGFMDKKLAGIC